MGFQAIKEGRKFHPSFMRQFLTVMEFLKKEGRNFEPSFTLVHKVSVASYVNTLIKKD